MNSSDNFNDAIKRYLSIKEGLEQNFIEKRNMELSIERANKSLKTIEEILLKRVGQAIPVKYVYYAGKIIIINLSTGVSLEREVTFVE